MKTTMIAAAIVLLTAPASYADTFGTDPNTTFEIEFVDIGQAGNPADTDDGDNNQDGIQNFGSVSYFYRMGKYEVSEEMINKANTLGGLGITHYNRGTNKPATNITWIEAVTFVNWLNTSEGHTPAYNFDPNGNFQLWDPNDAGYNPNNLFRNTQAFYVLPSADEWYKAAYRDPFPGGYSDYPTGSDTAPTAVASGTAADTAVYDQSGPADITQAGGLSDYGTMGQGGNVWEWEETEYDLVNDSSSSARGNRGGDWGGSDLMHATLRRDLFPLAESFDMGFRVASVPEPTTCTLALAALCLAMSRRRAF